jgi:hypothetical protein
MAWAIACVDADSSQPTRSQTPEPLPRPCPTLLLRGASSRNRWSLPARSMSMGSQQRQPRKAWHFSWPVRITQNCRQRCVLAFRARLGRNSSAQRTGARNGCPCRKTGVRSACRGWSHSAERMPVTSNGGSSSRRFPTSWRSDNVENAWRLLPVLQKDSNHCATVPQNRAPQGWECMDMIKPSGIAPMRLSVIFWGRRRYPRFCGLYTRMPVVCADERNSPKWKR